MTNSAQTGEIEQVIMEALRPFIREMLMIDPAQLIALLQFQKHAEVSDLIESATEQYFAPDFLAYREVGVVNLDWSSSLAICLEMVINAPGHAFEFSLHLEKDAAGVSLNRVSELVGLQDGVNPVAALKRAVELNVL